MKTEKTCVVHGVLKKEDIRIKKHKDGNYLTCVLCQREGFKKYYRRTKEKRLKEAAEYREVNREKLAEWQREYRAKNKNDPKITYRTSRENYLRDKESVSGKYYLMRVKDYLKRTYGITLAQYEDMVKAQDNKCAICGQLETRKEKKYDFVCRLCVDHDHITGKVRALLCHDCNTAIGKFKENVKVMKLAIAYLEHHK